MTNVALAKVFTSMFFEEQLELMPNCHVDYY